MDRENSIAKVKGVGDRLWVTLDPEQPLADLTAEVEALFKKMKRLAENANVVIDAGEKETSQTLLPQFESMLKERFSVKAVTIPPEKQTESDTGEKLSAAPGARRIRGLGKSRQFYRNDALLLAGRIRSGQQIKAAKHLVILGDVNPGAEVVAGGDILIMGSLCGKASAGFPDDPGSIVLALDLRPTQLQIGGFVAAGMTGDSRNGTEYARVEDGFIVVEDYLEANPFKRIQWPEFR
jgi:septum site-determining protein MinC